MGLMKRYLLEEAERAYAEHLRELREQYPESDDPELDEEFDRLMEKDD
jgi:hypothetical protein